MEEKIESNYFSPDFDPKKVPKRLNDAKKNRWYAKTWEDRFEVSNHMQIRTMAPFNMRCNGCGHYTNKGSKIQSNVDKMPDWGCPNHPNGMYFGKLTIWRFHVRCPNCKAVIVFRTDPEHRDYDIVSGATRSFRSAYVRARQEHADEIAEKEIEDNNPMKLLEDRTLASKNELEQVELLEDLQEIREKPSQTDAKDLLNMRNLNELEKAKLLLQEGAKNDELEIKEMLIKQNTVILEEDENDNMDIMKPKLVIRVTENGMTSTENETNRGKGSGPRPGKNSFTKPAVPKTKSSLGIKRKANAMLVKPKVAVKTSKMSGLMAAYSSDSDSD